MKNKKLLTFLVATSMVLTFGVGLFLKANATEVQKYAPTAPPKETEVAQADTTPKYAPTAPQNYAPTAPQKETPTAPAKDNGQKYAPAPNQNNYAPTAPSKDNGQKYAPTAPQEYAPTSDEQSVGTSKSLNSSSFQTAFIKALNEYRSSKGLDSVSAGGLSSYTSIRAKEAQRVWSHTRPNGERFSKFYHDTSTSTRFVGENLHQSPWNKRIRNLTADELAKHVLESWKKSPSHNSLLLDSRLSYATISYDISGSTLCVCLWMNG